MIVQCPGCANTANFEQRDDDFACLICGAVFGKKGDIHTYEQVELDKPKKDPRGKPQKSTTGKPAKTSKRQKLF